MALEIEKKAWLCDLEKIENEIKSFASFVKTDIKSDIYYFSGDINNIDFENDKIFRIRKDNTGFYANYKKREFIGNTEINQETEFEVINPDDLEKIFFYMGYKILVKKVKHSKVYSYKNALIEINHIEDLGNFIEIEVIVGNESEKELAIELINEIFNKLNIDKNMEEKRYYIDLLLEKRKEKEISP